MLSRATAVVLLLSAGVAHAGDDEDASADAVAADGDSDDELSDMSLEELLGVEVTINDEKARRELGYRGKVGREQSLRAMAAAHARQG